MKLAHLIPPSHKRIGGLETALRGLTQALEHTSVKQRILTPGISQPPQIDGADALHVHGMWEPSYSPFYQRAKKLQIPIIVSPHGMLEPWAWEHKKWKKLPYFHFVEKPRLRKATLLTTSSLERDNLKARLPDANVQMLPLGLKPPQDLPHPIEARHRIGLPHDERICLFLSRIDPKKGLDLLLAALRDRRLRGLQGFSRLVIVGSGNADYVQKLRDYSERHQEELPWVDWIGPITGDERFLYFRAADLFVLPTHSENFGLAVLESLMCGTQVLTTDQTPWKDFQREGVWIIPPEQEALTRALEYWEQADGWSDLQRQRLEDWAHQHFAWGNLASRYVKFYESFLKKKQPTLNPS